jgi:hypothetical protein
LLLHFICEIHLDNQDFRTRADLVRGNFSPANWRVMPAGHDSHGNAYWLFDDCRLYKEMPSGSYPQASASYSQDIGGSEPIISLEDPQNRCNEIEKSDSLTESTETTISTPVTSPKIKESTSGLKLRIKAPKILPWSLVRLLSTQVCSTKEEWKEFPKRFQYSKNWAEKLLYKHLEDLVPLILQDIDTIELLKKERDNRRIEEQKKQDLKRLQYERYEEEMRQRELEREMEKEVAEIVKYEPPKLKRSARIATKKNIILYDGSSNDDGDIDAFSDAAPLMKRYKADLSEEPPKEPRRTSSRLSSRA